MLRSLAAALIATLWAGAAMAGDQPFIGQVDQVGSGFCAKGWVPTNGQLLSIKDYPALFMLIGVRFGGDGVNNFALPNIPGTADQSGQRFMSCIALEGVYSIP